MKTLLLCFLCVTVSVAAARAEADPDSAIRKVLEDQVDAWNHGDLDKFMQGYWHSPELTFFSGATRMTGFDQARDRYVRKYRQDGQPMGHLGFTDLKIVVSGELGFVRGGWELARGKDHLGGLFTLVFRKFPDGWRIVHDHTAAQDPAKH